VRCAKTLACQRRLRRTRHLDMPCMAYMPYMAQPCDQLMAVGRSLPRTKLDDLVWIIECLIASSLVMKISKKILSTVWAESRIELETSCTFESSAIRQPRQTQSKHHTTRPYGQIDADLNYCLYKMVRIGTRAPLHSPIMTVDGLKYMST